ncbi:MAG: hypothetical protein R2939_19410 [Kofleriaceae bacterium]
MQTTTAAALGVALLALAAAPAQAGAPTCASLENPVYLQIGDTQQPLIKALGRELRDNLTYPLTLVYKTSGSCTNIDAIVNDTPITTNLLYVPSIAEDAGWESTDPALPCTPPPGGVIPNIANSNVFVSACTTDALPATVGSFEGPIQAYVMAVPELSSQIAMTYAEAYFAFGFGAAGMAMPWTDESQLFIRTVTKSTLLSWAASIAVPADRWFGIRYDSSSEVVSSLINSPTPERAVGILGAEVYDERRDELDVLAYKAAGQYFAYYPDSSLTSFDKRNVRDGHYTVWSPTVYLTHVDGGGAPLSAEAEYVIDLIRGRAASPTPMFSPVEVVAARGLVPNCAMEVQRSFEGGPLTPYAPAEPCVCAYEDLVDTSSCAPCDESTPCATGVCRAGFCEER